MLSRFPILRLTLAAATTLGLSAVAPTASAGHVAASGIVFGDPVTVTPGAVGEPNAPFVTNFIDFSYGAEVDQAGAAFVETGGGFFGTFRTTLGGPPIPNTGLGTDYQMYALFQGAGTVSGSLATGIDGVFSVFTAQLFVDKDMNTVLTNPAPGGANESVGVAAGGGDDVLVLTGTLLVSPSCITPTNPAGFCGGFHVFPGLAAGDFDVELNVTNVGGFFSPVEFADLNGVNTQITGIAPPPSTFIDGRIIGSGNMSFAAVPEPSTLGLLGLALLGAGAFARRRKT